MTNKTKKMTTLAMLCAMAFICVACIRIPLIPAAPFLTYEPKDAIIAIGGFIFGPLSALLIAVIVALVELVTISSTGIIGMVMNILSSFGFAFVASAVYCKKRTLSGAVLGLACGVFMQTALMLLWNYFITPIYMGTPRSVVAGMLLPVFLPFNLIKSSINAVLTMLIYKPAVTALRKAGLVPQNNNGEGKISVGVVIVSAVLLVLLICIVVALKKFM